MTDPAARIDPMSRQLCPTRWFDDYEIGETFYIPSRTMTDALFSAFQLASGDNHPIHYDRHWCKAHGHRELLAHGYQVVIQTCAGAGQLPHVMGDALVAFLEQGSKFLGAASGPGTGMRLARRAAAEGTGVLAVLHDLNLAAAFADRIALLGAGRLVICAAPEAALESARLSALYGAPIRVERAASGRPVVIPDLARA